jgi:uncharacterized protein (TIGR02284 family)
MDRTDKDTVAVLNDLIATCKDGMNGFESAADAVETPAAKALFTSRVASIEQSMSDLQDAVLALGGDPAESGHAAESLRRGWINMTAALAGNDEHEIVEETLRGEETAVAHYREALETPLPDAVRRLVEHQLHGALQNVAAVRALLLSPASPPSARAASSFDVRPQQ